MCEHEAGSWEQAVWQWLLSCFHLLHQEVTDEQSWQYFGMPINSLRPALGPFLDLEVAQLIALKNFLRDQYNYYPFAARQVLFIPASTVPISPLVEALYSLLLETPFHCRIPGGFSLEFYRVCQERLPVALRGWVQFNSWPSSDWQSTSAALAQCDTLIVHGQDATVTALQAQAAAKRFLGFGQKAALVVLDRQQNSPSELAELLQDDLLTFQQLGCLSPQVLYVHKAAIPELRALGAGLSAALPSLGSSLSPAQRYRKQTFLEQQLAQERASELWDEGLLLSEREDFEFGIGLGTLWLKPLRELSRLPERTRAINGRISTIANNLTVAEQQLLAELFPGVRLCSLGEMQKPGIFPWQIPTHFQLGSTV